MEVASINLTQLEQLSLPDTRNSSYKGSSLEQIGKVVIPLEAFASNTSGTLMKNLPYNVINATPLSAWWEGEYVANDDFNRWHTTVPVCIPYDFWEFNGRLRILIFVKENVIVILKDQILLKVLQSLGQINFVKTLTHLLTSLWADKEPCYAHWLHFCGNTQVI